MCLILLIYCIRIWVYLGFSGTFACVPVVLRVLGTLLFNTMEVNTRQYNRYVWSQGQSTYTDTWRMMEVGGACIENTTNRLTTEKTIHTLLQNYPKRTPVFSNKFKKLYTQNQKSIQDNTVVMYGVKSKYLHRHMDAGGACIENTTK
jgi:hypothetical protein